MALLVVCAVSRAGNSLVTLTMDDLPTQPLDGLAHPSGVTFGFELIADLSQIPANELDDLPEDIYNDVGPGVTRFVSDPSAIGSTAGALTLEFMNPTDVLEFGVAFSSPNELEHVATINLFDSLGGLVESVALEGGFGFGFPDAQFLYSGAPIKTAVIDFTPSFVLPLFPVSEFVFDNLTFNPVPEPATGLLAGACVLAAAPRRRLPDLEVRQGR